MGKVIPFKKLTQLELLVDVEAGRISSSRNADDFGERMQRIKSSLDRINRLMAELKKAEKNVQD